MTSTSYEHFYVSAQQTQEIVDSLVSAEGIEYEKPFGVYLVQPKTPAALLAKEIEAQVFLEYFGNNVSTLKDEYDHYDLSSTFILLIDHQKKRPVGMLRIINHSPNGLKTLEALHEAPWNIPVKDMQQATGLPENLDSVSDAATLAVLKEYRVTKSSKFSSLILYYASYALALMNNVSHLTMIYDKISLKLLTSLGVTVHSFPHVTPAPYLGSPLSFPGYILIKECEEKLQKHDKHALIAPPFRKAQAKCGLSRSIDALHSTDFTAQVQTSQ